MLDHVGGSRALVGGDSGLLPGQHVDVFNEQRVVLEAPIFLNVMLTVIIVLIWDGA